MPIMNGFESTKKIKSFLSTLSMNTKILGNSAFTSEYDKKKCFEFGMDDYESKPLNNEKVESLLAKWYPNNS